MDDLGGGLGYKRLCAVSSGCPIRAERRLVVRRCFLLMSGIVSSAYRGLHNHHDLALPLGGVGRSKQNVMKLLDD
jgi:hypothetical protein